MNRRVLTAIFVLVAALPGRQAALAQTAGATVGTCLAEPPTTACPPFSVAVELRDVKVGGTTVGLSLGFDHLELTAWSAETFGPLGNVIFELEGELRSGPVARARLSARGVIASVAARAALVAAGADPERFDPLAVAADGRPLLGGPVLGLELGGTFRLDRQVVLDVAPAAYLAPAGAALDLDATLRLLRALGPNELQLHLQGALLPGALGDHAALGASVVLPRGREPDWTFGLWAGLGKTGVLPGATLAMAEDLLPGVRVGAEAAYQPYRSDVRPLRAALSLTAGLGGPDLELRLAGGALHGEAPDALAARLGLTWTLPDWFR